MKCGWADGQQTDGHKNDQRKTIISLHYRVAGTKISISMAKKYTSYIGV